MSYEGMEIEGRYRLLRHIGEGGMAEVWLAEHITLRQHVAIKLISTQGPRAERQKRRFLREARVAAAVHHRNVIEILDFGTTIEEAPFIVMQLLQGENLAQRLYRRPPMILEDFLGLMVHALSGLAAVHDAGIVHRDIKPSNVFIVSDADGEFAKLLDFGVSRTLDTEDDELGPLTEEGILVGTLQYIAPEKARGEADDIRSDIYSMGLIIYEAISGTRAFGAKDIASVLFDISSVDLRPLAEVCPVPEFVSGVVERAIAKDPNDRYQSARDFRSDLKQALESLPEGVLTTPLPPMVIRSDSESLGLSAYISARKGTTRAPSEEAERRRKRMSTFFFSLGVGSLILASIGLLWNLLATPSNSSSPTVRSHENEQEESHRSRSPETQLPEADIPDADVARGFSKSSSIEGPSPETTVLDADVSRRALKKVRRPRETRREKRGDAGIQSGDHQVEESKGARTGEMIRDLGF